MSIALLVLFAALGASAPEPGPEVDPTKLVARLGSPEPAEHAEAARALEALGRQALPALEAALIKTNDPSFRERASASWDRIQRDLMTRPTLVRPVILAKTRPEIVADLANQTGFTLQYRHDNQQGRVAPTGPASVPFWSALESLGLRGVLHHQVERGTFPRLELSNASEWVFTSSAGPFRVALTGLHLHSDRQLVRGPWVRIDSLGQRINVTNQEELKGESVTFFGGLELVAEPRMWFTQDAPARLIEASDNLGQSLVLETAEFELETAEFETPLEGHAPIAFSASRGVTNAEVEFRLRVTERRGQSAPRLRGVVPLMLHVRRPEPALLIPLAGASGKTFQCDDVAVEIENVSDSATSTSVSLIARLNVDKADVPADSPFRAELIMSRMSMIGAHQLELIDDAGTVLADSASGGGRSSVYRWHLSTSPNGHATHLRYTRMLRVPYEAGFDFRDVPLP